MISRANSQASSIQSSIQSIPCALCSPDMLAYAASHSAAAMPRGPCIRMVVSSTAACNTICCTLPTGPTTTRPPAALGSRGGGAATGCDAARLCLLELRTRCKSVDPCCWRGLEQHTHGDELHILKKTHHTPPAYTLPPPLPQNSCMLDIGTCHYTGSQPESTRSSFSSTPSFYSCTPCCAEPCLRHASVCTRMCMLMNIGSLGWKAALIDIVDHHSHTGS